MRPIKFALILALAGCGGEPDVMAGRWRVSVRGVGILDVDLEVHQDRALTGTGVLRSQSIRDCADAAVVEGRRSNYRDACGQVVLRFRDTTLELFCTSLEPDRMSGTVFVWDGRSYPFGAARPTDATCYGGEP